MCFYFENLKKKKKTGKTVLLSSDLHIYINIVMLYHLVKTRPSGSGHFCWKWSNQLYN